MQNIFHLLILSYWYWYRTWCLTSMFTKIFVPHSTVNERLIKNSVAQNNLIAQCLALLHTPLIIKNNLFKGITILLHIYRKPNLVTTYSTTVHLRVLVKPVLQSQKVAGRSIKKVEWEAKSELTERKSCNNDKTVNFCPV